MIDNHAADQIPEPYPAKNSVINAVIGSGNEKILINKKLKIHLTVGKKEDFSKIIDLKKGKIIGKVHGHYSSSKIIVIDYCNRQNQKGKTIKTICFEQYKKNVEFD